MKKRLKTKYIIRRTVAIIILFALIIIGFNVIGNPPTNARESYICEEYVVAPGDRFWNIASRYIDSTKSKWDYIDACQKINGKQLGDLQAGETILVITNY